MTNSNVLKHFSDFLVSDLRRCSEVGVGGAHLAHDLSISKTVAAEQ